MVACNAILQCYYVSEELVKSYGNAQGNNVVRNAPTELRDFLEAQKRDEEPAVVSTEKK